MKTYQSLYGITINILYNMGENVVAIIHIYGDRAIFLLFCYRQDTEYESQVMEIGIACPLFSHKKISKAVW